MYAYIYMNIYEYIWKETNKFPLANSEMGTKSNLEISIKILEPEVHETDSTDIGFKFSFQQFISVRIYESQIHETDSGDTDLSLAFNNFIGLKIQHSNFSSIYIFKSANNKSGTSQ